ncbi:MAG: murein biosynthesis integral membrane protein MurJ [Fervidobacterium sp.]|uniref:Probable lipid II flippase MurJ n=1 Tax=Fervidobacterium gondwanense DSM 13020 TaxID=1121883 RepID=A0A1M7SR51_FERGO|nr:murein biosynthesis integral membrane protein MurJ [Fervidobacterium gondwanense]UXF00620.1 membrane protein [Fervidobacterium riparium]SHN60931.1 putative peptidoglycan lipid II flippase [Fervidobacterium gondwanense DSM 13020]
MSVIISSLAFAVATFLSRILGLVRDMLMASKFGTSWQADAYFVAILFPFFLRRVFGEGAMTSAFVPLYAEAEEKDEFLSSVLTSFTLVLLVIVALVMIFPDIVVYLFSSGAAEQTKELIRLLTRITAPSILFIFWWAITYSIENTRGKFFYPALTPIIPNIVIILFMLIPGIGIFGPTWGFLIGEAAAFLALAYPLRRHRLKLSFKYTKTFLKLFWPSFLAMSISQINSIVDTNVVSYYSKGYGGGVSYLQYASRFYMLPYGLFGVAVATVILSTISNDRTNYSKHLKSGLTSTLFFTVPATVGLIVLDEPILRLFYEYGQFTANDTRITAQVLNAYVVGLPFYGMYSTMARARHAMKDMKTPLKATTIVAISNVVMDLLVGLKYGPVGVALATSVAGIIGFLYLLSKEQDKRLFEKDDLYILLSAVLMGILTYYFISISTRRIWVIPATVFGALVYLLLSAVFLRGRVKEFLKRRR